MYKYRDEVSLRLLLLPTPHDEEQANLCVLGETSLSRPLEVFTYEMLQFSACKGYRFDNFIAERSKFSWEGCVDHASRRRRVDLTVVLTE